MSTLEVLCVGLCMGSLITVLSIYLGRIKKEGEPESPPSDVIS